MTRAATAPHTDPSEAVEGEVVEPAPGGLSTINSATRAEVDVQISTAKRYPRSVRAARDMAMSMALVNEYVAASCCYTLKRGGKGIKGPSVRLAEIMVQAWGNIRAETRVLNPDAITIESESVCWDLERNVAIRAAVKRRITGNKGRFNDDMIVMTGNAAASIAFRNAVFRVIPKTFVHEIYDACEALAIGDIKTLTTRRSAALEYFARFGINSADVCKKMGRESVDGLTLDDVAQLKAMAEAVKRGDETIDSVFAEEPAAKPAATASSIADAAKEQLDEIENERVAKAKATEAAPTPAEQSRRAAALRLVNGCTPGENGCAKEASADATGKLRCLTHANEAQAEKITEAPASESASGELPGMGSAAASNRPRKK